MSIDFSSTIVIPHDDPSAWWGVPGPVSAISGRETIVLGLVDDEPAVRHFDGDQQQGKTVAMKAPRSAALFTPTGATTVDTGGDIWSIDFATGDHEPLGTLGIGVDGGQMSGPGGHDDDVELGRQPRDCCRRHCDEGDRAHRAAKGELQPFVPLPGSIGRSA